MSLVPSLLQAIVRVDGDALVMHPGDKPYVVAPTGQVELASRGLTLEAVNGIVSQLLPADLQQTLEEFGAVQYELPEAAEFPGERFTVVAARGGDDVWMEIRRFRVADDDRVPEEFFGPSASPAAAAPPMEMPAIAAPPVMLEPAAAVPVMRSAVPTAGAAVMTPPHAHHDDDRDYVPVETLGFRDAPEERREDIQGRHLDEGLLLPNAGQLWPERPPSGLPGEDQGDVEVPMDVEADIDLDLDSEEETSPPSAPPLWQQPAERPHVAPVVPIPALEAPPLPEIVVPAQAAAMVPSQQVAALPSQLHLETQREIEELERQASGLLEAVRGQMETLGAKKKEFEAFDERMRTLQSGVGKAESRMEALSAKDKNLSELTQKVDGLSKRFEGLFAQADDLTKKQVELDTLHVRLEEVDDLAKKTTSQLDSLQHSRQDLDLLRTQIEEVAKTHADVATLGEKTSAELLGLDAFGERIAAFATLAPALEAQMDAMTGKLKLVEDGNQKATRLHQSVAELDAQISRVNARVPLVEDLEGRLNGLSELSADIDRKLHDQLARGVELDTLKAAYDGLEAQMVDAQQKLHTVSELQTTLAPLVGEVTRLRADVGDAEKRLHDARFNEAIVEKPSVPPAQPGPELLGLEAFGERIAAFATLAPALEAKMDAMTGKLKLVEDGNQKATRLHQSVAELDAQISRVNARVPLVEDLEGRLNGLNELSADIDRKLRDQLARRVELDTLKAACDGLEAQMLDAQQKLHTVSELQTTLTPLVGEVTRLRADVGAAEKRLQAAPFNEAVIGAKSSAAMPPQAMAAPPSSPPAVLPPQQTAPPSTPAVVLSIARNSIRSDQPPPAVSDPTLSGLERLLRVSAARGASTLYLSSESRPSVRVDGELQELEGEPVHVPRDVESLLLTLMPERSHEALRTGAATEWICDIEAVGRVRCMSFRDHRGPGGVFRLMPTRSVSADQLGLPRQVQALAMEPEGLVLVAGSRSSGKRTLMSAFVDLMNRTRRDHVITIEREINIVHERGNSFISQREVRGNDEDMLSAARAALREDPDVLVIEDLHTGALMDVALEAAGAGRLVIGGFSAHTATGAIDRIIDLYAPEQRPPVQFALAESLRGVIVQVLLHKIGGGRLPAREVLLNTPAVSSAIAEGKTSQLPMAIEGGRRHGMMPLNDALVGLVQTGVVEAREAYRRSADRPGFLAALHRQGIDTSFMERLG